MLSRLCVTGVMVVSLALAQKADAQKPAESGSYEDLKLAQKRLVEDWLARVENVVGKSITPEALYDAVPVSVRTTFEAVTHALMTTELSDESGQSAGTALDLVAKLDAVAGKAEGAGGDEQFRIYVQLKPDAYKTLLRTRQFVRSMDNTSYHRGFPICFRTPGIPSIQISMSRDQMRGDIDVDYRSPKMPQALVNGHLTSSNSDIQAGNHYTKHVERWNGLGEWWKGFFGLPLRLRGTDPVEDERGAEVNPSNLGKGDLEQAMDDFLKTWLVDQLPTRAMAYFSPKSFSCLLAGEQKEQMDRGMSKFKLQKSMRQVNAKIGKVSNVTEVIQPASLEFKRIRNIKEAAGKGYTLFEVRDDAAADAECDYRYGIVDPPMDPKEKFGTYYGTAFKLVSGKTKGNTVYLLWAKERGSWRIITYEVEPPGEKGFQSPRVTRVTEEAPRVPGNAEMLKTNHAFLTAWLVKGDIKKAMGFVADSCLSCVGLYAEDGPKQAANGEDARRRMAETMRKSREEIGSGSRLDSYLRPVEVSTSAVQVITQPDEKTFTVIGMPDQVMGALDCRKRTTQDLLPVKMEKPQFGNYYATVIRPKYGASANVTLYLVWAQESGAWKIAAYHLDVP